MTARKHFTVSQEGRMIRGCVFNSIAPSSAYVLIGPPFEFATDRGGMLVAPTICENLFISDVPPKGSHWAFVKPRLGRVGRLLRRLGGVVDEVLL